LCNSFTVYEVSTAIILLFVFFTAEELNKLHTSSQNCDIITETEDNESRKRRVYGADAYVGRHFRHRTKSLHTIT
jgi:hypothetical protein